MKKPVLLVMAAGMGSRYGGLKQIDKMTDAGEIILDFSLYDAYKAGFRKVVFIIREENRKDFDNILGSGAGKFLDIEYVYQSVDDVPDKYKSVNNRVKPWGTAHAIMTARNVIDEPFAVINADDFYGREAFEKMYGFLSNIDDKGQFAMVCYSLKNTVTDNGSVSRGICTIGENGLLHDIVERTKIIKKEDEIFFTEDEINWQPLHIDTPVSMNFWGYTPEMMKEIETRFESFLEEALKKEENKEEYQIPKVTDEVIKEGKATCQVLTTEGVWYGVTYKEDKEVVKEALEKLKREGIYPNVLWK